MLAWKRLFFVILGNTSSGGAVAPSLLPQPFAFLSQWLPTGVTVTAVCNPVYFPAYQHPRPSWSPPPGPRFSLPGGCSSGAASNPPERPSDEQRTDRGLTRGGSPGTFSDQVMAVITIMAFGLDVPRNTSGHALRQQLASLQVYVLSLT